MSTSYRPGRVFFAALLVAWGFSSLQTLVPTDTLCIAVAFLMVLSCAFLLRGHDPKRRTLLWLLLGAGASLIYLLKQPYDFSYHDLAAYEVGSDGHLGFIAYIVEKGTLPWASETEQLSIYYNPPLYHLLQALFLKLNLTLGFAQEAALENLQAITFAFATLCPYTAVNIAGQLGAKERGKALTALATAFAPIVMILGATLNNDAMMLALLLLSICYLLRWYESRQMKEILLTGLYLGCAMATKLNAAIAIPAMAILLAVTFFRERENQKRLMGQYAAFLCVSVPEAVAWPLYHLLVCHMPLNYVRLPSETINISGYSLWERFGFPSGKVLRALFYSGIRKVDHNLWMQTLKTGLFDERAFFEEGSLMWYVSWLLLAAFALLLVAMLVFFLWMLLKKEHPSGLIRVFLGVYAVTLFGYYLKFCLDYPYVCTFSFRYIAPLLFLGAAALGLARERLKHGKWLCILAGVFSLLSVVVYGVYFFGPSLFGMNG